MRRMTASAVMAALGWAFCFTSGAVVAAGCASQNQEAASGTSAPAGNVSKDEASEMAHAVPPEKLEELDMFFHRKAAQLQFDCYNPEVENTHKKYEGNVSIALVVQPGGKASDVKLTASSLRSTDDSKVKAPGIENCVLDAVKTWSWPDVNEPAPYTGSVNFKPAW